MLGVQVMTEAVHARPRMDHIEVPLEGKKLRHQNVHQYDGYASQEDGLSV